MTPTYLDTDEVVQTLLAEYWDKEPQEAHLKNYRFIIFKQDNYGYEGSMHVLYQDTTDGNLYMVDSSHCSCNGYDWWPRQTPLAFVQSENFPKSWGDLPEWLKTITREELGCS